MAGILANSASATMVGGDTAVDKAVSGYVTGEQVTLSTSPTGSAYLWGQSVPPGATSPGNLSSTTATGPTFTPNVAGIWVVTVTVDSTTDYVIRISVTQSAVTTSYEGIRYSPKTAASITAPAVGETVFWDSTYSRFRAKDSSGTTRDIDSGARTGTLTFSGGAATITDSTITASTVVALSCTTATDRGTITWAMNAGVSAVAASSDGADASVYNYALIG